VADFDADLLPGIIRLGEDVSYANSGGDGGRRGEKRAVVEVRGMCSVSGRVSAGVGNIPVALERLLKA
jgi:hypothetical protein